MAEINLDSLQTNFDKVRADESRKCGAMDFCRVI